MADLDIGEEALDQQLRGLDHLELALPAAPSRGSRIWRGTWPIVTAVIIGLLLWQLVAWTGWKPQFPGALTTLRRGIEFYLMALVIGTLLATVVTRSAYLRTAVSPLVSGLQTMPSVAWVPFAILLFGAGTIRPIMFVALMGTIPAITIGTISAIDAVPPTLLRAGRILGAHGLAHYRHVVLPAALPGYVAAMKQGWAFLWRSLMAGELISPVVGTKALGQLLASYQEQSTMVDVVATMLMILVIGLLMDTVVFSRLERIVLSRRGLNSARI
jgi:NitT/TauT family transport system permease protein